jgi:GDP-L-fucose synthase
VNKNSSILVAGGKGMVGAAIVRKLKQDGYENVFSASRENVDFTNHTLVCEFMNNHKFEYVFMCAAKVGGIYANNTYPAEFIRDNLSIQSNLIDASYVFGVKKLVFLGSSCIYPKECPQPIKEEYLLSGKLETTNSPYAIAKICGIEMIKAYRRQYGFKGISLMPTNLYGPGDNFHPLNSHVLPALISRFHKAKISGDSSVAVWGTGMAKREFLHVDDLAQAAIHLMQSYDEEDIINIGTGEDVTIKELTESIAKTVGYNGDILWDDKKPDGTMRKVLDVSKIHGLGWKHSIDLKEGLKQVYDWYKLALDLGSIRN